MVRRVGRDDPDRDRRRTDGGLAHRLQQRLYSLAGAGADGHDRHADVLAHLPRIDRQAALLGQVAHVQRKHRRQTQTQCLGRENEITTEIRRVGDDQQRLGPAIEMDAPLEIVASNLRFRPVEIQAVDARQIHDVNEFSSAVTARSNRGVACMRLDG